MIESTLTADEISRRGEELYERNIRPSVEANNEGRYVVVDVLSGDYEMGDNILDLVHALRRRRPDAQPFSLRIGYGATGRIGGRLRPVNHAYETTGLY